MAVPYIEDKKKLIYVPGAALLCVLFPQNLL